MKGENEDRDGIWTMVRWAPTLELGLQFYMHIQFFTFLTVSTLRTIFEIASGNVTCLAKSMTWSTKGKLSCSLASNFFTRFHFHYCIFKINNIKAGNNSVKCQQLCLLRAQPTKQA